MAVHCRVCIDTLNQRDLPREAKLDAYGSVVPLPLGSVVPRPDGNVVPRPAGNVVPPAAGRVVPPPAAGKVVPSEDVVDEVEEDAPSSH